MRGKRVFRYGLSGAFAVLLLCGGFGTCIVVRSWQNAPMAAVTPGPDTTYLEGPLDEFGYVDYAAALNQQMSEGVTPENNAAVLLLQAFGPPPGDAEFRREFYRLLDIEPLPAEGEYFISPEKLLERGEIEVVVNAYENRSSRDEPNPQEQFWRDHNEAATRPWTAAEFPHLARWIEKNDTPLERIREASLRSECYVPVVLLTPDEGLISASSWLPQASREAVGLLCIRATLRIGEGRFDEAWKDLFAGYRLARYFGQSPLVLDGIFAWAMEGTVVQSQSVLLHDGDPTPEQIQRIRDDVSRLPSPCSIAQRIGYGDRLQSLDCLAYMSHSLAKEMDISEDNELGQKLVGTLTRSAMDWNEMLRITNRYYDDLVKAVEHPVLRERHQALDALESSIEEQLEQARGFTRVARSFITSRSPRTVMSKHIANVQIELLHSTSVNAIEGDERALTTRRMAIITLGAAAYRDEYGVYPESLDALATYLPEIPVDPWSEKAFCYRLEGDGFVLYSVGPNGRDDGGRWGAGSYGNLTDEEPQADDISLHVPPESPVDEAE